VLHGHYFRNYINHTLVLVVPYYPLMGDYGTAANWLFSAYVVVKKRAVKLASFRCIVRLHQR